MHLGIGYAAGGSKEKQGTCVMALKTAISL